MAQIAAAFEVRQLSRLSGAAPESMIANRQYEAVRCDLFQCQITVDDVALVVDPVVDPDQSC